MQGGQQNPGTVLLCFPPSLVWAASGVLCIVCVWQVVWVIYVTDACRKGMRGVQLPRKAEEHLGIIPVRQEKAG